MYRGYKNISFESSLSSTCYIKPYILQPQYSDQITFYKTNYQHIVTYIVITITFSTLIHSNLSYKQLL